MSLAETRNWLRKYISRTGTVYTNFPDGSWGFQKKNGKLKRVLDCAYISESKFDETYCIIEEKKKSSLKQLKKSADQLK